MTERSHDEMVTDENTSYTISEAFITPTEDKTFGLGDDDDDEDDDGNLENVREDDLQGVVDEDVDDDDDDDHGWNLDRTVSNSHLTALSAHAGLIHSAVVAQRGDMKPSSHSERHDDDDTHEPTSDPGEIAAAAAIATAEA